MSPAVAALPVSAIAARFQALLPCIERHARICFRHLQAHYQYDAIAEAIALAWKWFVRLVRRSKDPAVFPSALATFAVRAVINGRRLCGQEKEHDVLSRLGQRRRGFTVCSLPTHGRLDETPFTEALRDNMQTPVPDAAAFRIDFPAWLAAQTECDRQLIEEMALGERATKLARRFGVSEGRVSQKRRQLKQDWNRFCGEPALAAA